MAEESGIKQIAANRKAYHDYFVDETYEAGVALVGTEVKSLRAGRVNLRDSYAELRGDELYLVGVHIGAYEQGNVWNHEPLRARHIVRARAHDAAHRALVGQLERVDLVRVGSRVKVELGLARGKRQYDKRTDLARRDAQRDVERALRGRGEHHRG